MFGEEGFTGSRPRAVSASMDSWAHHRGAATRHSRRERSRQSFIKLLSQYDKTGRLIVPSFSKEVAFEVSMACDASMLLPQTIFMLQVH